MSQVKDIIDGIKHRLPDRANIYPALNRAVRMVNKRLFYHKSSMIQGSLAVTIAAAGNSGDLPTDFWGLMERPYITGETWTLEPVPDQETKLRYTDDSIPIYYDVKGWTLYLYPGSTSGCTIGGDYWQRPTAVTSPTDTMPYHELFDDAISEVLIKVYQTGAASGDTSEISLMENFINGAVDQIVPYIEKKAPKRFSDFNSLDFMSNEDYW